MQIDWVEFRPGADPLYALCATLGYSRTSYVAFVPDMKLNTLIDCHQHAFEALGGVARRWLKEVANVRIPACTQVQPAQRLSQRQAAAERPP